MDISLNKTSAHQSASITNRIDTLGLKLNQQLEATVININKQTLTIALQTNQFNKSIQVESNLPIITKTGQYLLLMVTKLFPSPEFKILNSHNQINLNSLALRQLVNTSESNATLLQQTQNVYQNNDLTIRLTEGQTNHLNNYKPGQLFTATIIDVKNNILHLHLSDNRPNHTSSISLAFNKLPSFESQALQKGQTIRLEMLTNGSQAKFKLLFYDSIQQQKILETFRRNLPIHEQPSILFNQIINNLHAINANENIPDTLKHLASEILANLLNNKNLKNPDQLKKTISNSGLFLEAKLGQTIEKNGTNTQVDLKNQLLKFLNELETAQGQKINPNNADLMKLIQQKTESTLANIILHQLASLPKDDGPRQIWTLEVPFLYKEIASSVHIEINHKQHFKNEENQKNWAVTVIITPPELGLIYCKIYCIDNICNTRFWSENQEVVNKITHHLDFLKDQLEKSGITPGHMSAHTGKPKTENHNPLKGQSLIDQKV